MKQLIILLAVSFLFTACEIDSYDKEYYFEVVGVGYIINGETNEPFFRGTAYYRATTERNGYGWGSGPLHIDKKFEVDENGYFRVKFLRRTAHRDVLLYDYPTNLRYKNGEITPTMLKNTKGVIHLDTIIILPDTIIIAEIKYYANADTLGAWIDIVNVYANNGIWTIEDNVNWLMFGRLSYPHFEFKALALPNSATECRRAIVMAKYPNGRKDKYIVVQAPRIMGYNPKCY